MSNKEITGGRYAQETVAIGWYYLGEEALDMDSSSQDCTLPTGTNVVEISAEGGAVRFTINDDASADSGGYVPEDQTRWVLKLENLTSLAVYGANPAVAHLNYYQEL
jgi:hypothetical protein